MYLAAALCLLLCGCGKKDAAEAQAVQQRDIGVTAQDRLVALSTCAGSETNGRVVVLGRLCPLKEGDEMQ